MAFLLLFILEKYLVVCYAGNNNPNNLKRYLSYETYFIALDCKNSRFSSLQFTLYFAAVYFTRYHIYHFAFYLFQVSSGSPRGNELSAIMERGELVPLEVVLDLLKEAIYKALPDSKGFLIDGYPREKEQGILFEKKIKPVDIVLFFDASEETLVKRLLGRAVTSGRVDDNEETIKKRLHTFNTHNNQVLAQYETKLKRVRI